MNTIATIATAEQETEAKKTDYQRKSHSIKLYLNTRYATDEDFKRESNKSRAENNKFRYNTDDEYRKEVLKYQKERRERMKEDERRIELENRDRLLSMRAVCS